MIKQRLASLRQAMAEANIEAILLINKANVRYLSGFSGYESYLLISAEHCALITDSRYSEQAEKECPLYEIILHQGKITPLPELVANLCRSQGIKNMAFEREYTSYALFEKLRRAVAESVELIPSGGLVERLRFRKSAAEIELLRQACSLTDKAFALICQLIQPGVTEKELAADLLYIINKLGCESSFPIIIASGANGSLPHAIPSDKPLASNEFITMDFGGMYHGYHADMTRTVFIGQPDQQQQQIYDIVLAAKQKAQALIKNNASCQEVDAAARDYITAHGYGDNFGHGLGHGVGLDIHEAPLMNPSSQQRLQTDTFVTVEPGIYLPGWGGVRIEDTLLVTESGYENMFTSPLEMVCL